jgi:hypothetical protein
VSCFLAATYPPIILRGSKPIVIWHFFPKAT